jgi:hypothetical protein
MKLLIVLAIVAVIAVTGMGLSDSEPISSETATIITSETVAADVLGQDGAEDIEIHDETSPIKKAVLKIKSGISTFLNDIQTEENKEVYEQIEQEAAAFATRAFEEIKDKMPEDFAVELVDFEINQIKEDELQDIKNQCKANSKYDAENIKFGFNVCGKARVEANGKSNLADVAMVVLKEGDAWKIYSFNCDFPEGVSIKDVLVDIFVK